ncbi:MAG: tyrosine-type recombinase/integrase [Egibacteraceae bacterium]
MASIQKRPDGKWRARYRDPDGRERAKHFARKIDAQRWLTAIEADLLRGSYVDPDAGKITLRRFAESWLAAQTFDPSTREAVVSRLRVHILPTLGDIELRAIRPSTVQAWLRGRQQEAAPTHVRVMLANVSAILGAAVEDGLIARNPCRTRAVKAPAIEGSRVQPWPTERVLAVADALPDRYRATAVVAAGMGLRQGEVFGLAVEDIDFLRGWVHVRQQVKIINSRLVFAPPKGQKVRDVPLAQSVTLELSAHVTKYPPVDVTLPWKTPEGEPRSVALIFSTRERKALNRTYYNPHVWKPALVAAGVEPTRANGMHALRHYYASVLLDAGENIRALADYLGHADPGFTLRVYTHLMPHSEDRARRAVDLALGPHADSVRTKGSADD